MTRAVIGWYLVHLDGQQRVDLGRGRAQRLYDVANALEAFLEPFVDGRCIQQRGEFAPLSIMSC